MADDAASDELHWYDPPQRTIIPLDAFHIPRRLKRTALHCPYQIKLNSAFTDVMRACAAPNLQRPKTWINEKIISLYSTLHAEGFAHSIELWDGAELAGGLYGVHINGAFFGESMVSRRRDASKIALVTLLAILTKQRFKLLDCQFMTKHLAQFGAVEISRLAYHSLLSDALSSPASFTAGMDFLRSSARGGSPSFPEALASSGAGATALLRGFLQPVSHTS